MRHASCLLSFVFLYFLYIYYLGPHFRGAFDSRVRGGVPDKKQNAVGKNILMERKKKYNGVIGYIIHLARI